MKRQQKYILLLITILLVGLWIPVALDKFWDLEGFRRTLLRQPFPDAWAGVLYWLLPLLELVCAGLLIGGSISEAQRSKLKTQQQKLAGLALSSLLMLAFTVFILLGVLGWYEKRPCGCGSVIAGLSWEQHLWFNLAFLLVSMVGLWLVWKKPSPPEPDRPSAGSAALKTTGSADVDPHPIQPFSGIAWSRFRYPKRFAPFPGQAGRTKHIPIEV